MSAVLENPRAANSEALMPVKLCTFNGPKVPQDLRVYVLSACPMHLESLPPNFGCVCEAKDVPPSVPVDVAPCLFPRTRDGRILPFQEPPGQKEQRENAKRAKEANVLSGQKKLFGEQEIESQERQGDSVTTAIQQATQATQPAPAASAVSGNGSSPPHVPAASAAPNLPPIWPNNVKIPLIGITGELGSGKTLFGLLIDPEHCLHLDYEDSSETYGSLPIQRVDVPAELAKIYPQGDYTPEQLALWSIDLFRKIPRGRFTVLCIDPGSEFENGLVQHVRKNPTKFGYTAQQFAKMDGLVWAAVKEAWKAILSDLMTRVQTVVVVMHMKNVWAGSSPVPGRREAKGKETIAELASLYLRLERKADEKGKMPEKPTAFMYANKNRLCVFVKNDKTGEFEPHPALPPRITECTPARIRWFLLNPPDYSKLKKDELAPEEQLTDEQKLLIQQDIATKEAIIAESHLAETLAKTRTVEAVQAARTQAAPGSGSGTTSNPVAPATRTVLEAARTEGAAGPKVPVATTNPAETTNHAATAAPAETVAAPQAAAESLDSEDSAAPKITDDQKVKIAELKDQMRNPGDPPMPQEKWVSILKKNYGVESAVHLTFAQADELIAKMIQKVEAINRNAGLNNWANNAAASAGSAEGN